MFSARNSLACFAVCAGLVSAGCSDAGSPDIAVSSTGLSTSRISTPSGQYVLQGAILQKFNESGGSTGPLGVPISNEMPGPNGGQYTKFQSGVIYWKPNTGAHIVWGGIRTAWEDNGGAGGPLGYPTSDERPVPGGTQSDFEHGTIAFTDSQAHVEMH